MPPHESENVASDLEPLPVLVAPQAAPRKYELVYYNIAFMTFCHVSGLYGVYLSFTTAKWATIFFTFSWYVLGELGIICGAHRLWTHRTFKAKLPLEVLLMLMNCIGFQNTIIDWARNHRLHHKYSDTDADPHNATRGLFFSHIGWLLVRKHPEVKRHGKMTYMDDIYSNPVLRFQKKYKVPLIASFCFIIPTLIPALCWDEGLFAAWNMSLLRYCTTLNGTWMTNSLAHRFGGKPYDKTFAATQNISVSLVTLGEGFHNYHHVFPWDYRAAELGNNWLNFTTIFIDICAFFGLAYDLKTVPDDVIRKRIARTGDGTNLWGWGDKDMTKEEMTEAEIRFPKKE